MTTALTSVQQHVMGPQEACKLKPGLRTNLPPTETDLQR